MSTKTEEGYCSTCFKKTKHKLVQQNYLRRNTYKCTNCGALTLMCRLCNNFTNGSRKWDDELCAEHNGEIANFTMLNHKLDNLEDYEILFKRESINFKKVGTITAATIGTAAVITPLAFAAAPAIGGAIGSVMGLSGAVATNAGLAAIGGGAIAAGGMGMAGGAAILGATGAALGGTLGGVISNSYFGDIDGFKIKKVKNGTGKIVIFIDGFLTQKNTETKDWEKELKKLYPNNPWYYLTWESKRLYDLGKQIGGHGGKEAIEKTLLSLAKKATKEGAKKVGPLGLALTALGIVNNPWSVACTKAGQTGVLLADIIARTNKEYILCGHSLGARVIYYALESLSTKNKKFIYTAHLLGGAVGSSKKDWEKAIKAVTNKIINYKSNNDYVLATMYKVGTFFTSNPIGRNNIMVKNIVNVDTTSIVKGHTKYKENFALFARV